MPRSSWKGAMAFGLVYIPVELYSAAKSGTLDLDMLDRRDFSPIGYQRINKRTGDVVDWGDIVKGYQYKKGQYVALSDEDFRQANLKATQTIEIGSFTDVGEISPEYYETPYYVVPVKGGEKPYRLLREALANTNKAGIGSMVMRGRQHVGVIRSTERLLMFITLRFADEIKSSGDLEIPAGAKVAPREVALAERLIEEMTAHWNPKDYHDTYREDLMKRIQEKIRNQQMHVLTPKERIPKQAGKGAEVIDLMAVLKKSLETSAAARKGKTTRHRRTRAAAHRRQSAR
jgi:DNA end-binding protein Ku